MRQITILIIGCLFFFGSGQLLHAQQYTGMSGLIHVPVSYTHLTLPTTERV